MKKSRLRVVLTPIERGTLKAVADVTLSAHLLGAITIRGFRIVLQMGRAPRVVILSPLYRIRDGKRAHRPTVVLSPVLAKNITRIILKSLSDL